MVTIEAGDDHFEGPEEHDIVYIQHGRACAITNASCTDVAQIKVLAVLQPSANIASAQPAKVKRPVAAKAPEGSLSAAY